MCDFFDVPNSLPYDFDKSIFVLATEYPNRLYRALNMANLTTHSPFRDEISSLSDEDIIWCEQIQKGLRADHWQESGLIINSQISVLKIWAMQFPGLWERLRLTFIKDSNDYSETMDRQTMQYSKKLNALWFAILDRVAN